MTFRHSDPLVWTGILYLAIPLMLFFSTWTTLPFALLSTSILIVAFAITFPQFRLYRSLHGALRKELVISILTAGIWTFSSGVWAGPFGRAGDWLERDDILSTLTKYVWPVTNVFEVNTAPETMRHYLSFYLPGSAVGKLFERNLSLTLFATGVWMMAGVALVFFMVFRHFGNLGAKKYLIIPVFILFSGLDAIGGRINGVIGFRLQHMPEWRVPEFQYSSFALNSGHIEWWVPEFQYSSFTTAMHWVPQHAISGWLGTMIVLRIFELKKHYAFLPFLVAVIFLWSTFTAVGVALVIVLQAIQYIRPKEILVFIRRILPFTALSTVLVTFLAMYLLTGTGSIPKFPIFSQVSYDAFNFDGPSQILRDYLLFIALEVGVYLILLFFILRQHRKELALVAFVLCLIPLYRIGMLNDFAMRASIPPLLLLMLLVAQGLLQKSHSPKATLLRLCLIVAFTLGSATPLYEFFARYHTDYKSLELPCIDSGCASQVARYEIRDFYWSKDMPSFIKIGSFPNDEYDGQVKIRIDGVAGAHGRESDGQNWWLWVERRVIFNLQPLYISKNASLTKLRFEYATRGEQTLTLRVSTRNGLSRTFSLHSVENELSTFEEIIDLPPSEVAEISIETDGQASSLSEQDSRNAAMMIRNVTVAPVQP